MQNVHAIYFIIIIMYQLVFIQSAHYIYTFAGLRLAVSVERKKSCGARNVGEEAQTRKDTRLRAGDRTLTARIMHRRTNLQPTRQPHCPPHTHTQTHSLLPLHI